jgi:Ser/Thr protein kinase RdoA (MazF antagonist)
MNYIGEAESFVYREEVFVHGDMTGRNILINYDNSKLAGIIDFSDAKM